MAKELISEIISPKAFEQLEKLNVELGKTIETFGKVLDSAKAFDTIIRGAKGLNELTAAIKNAEAAQKKLNSAAKRSEETAKAQADAQKSAADSINAYNKRIKELTKEYNALGTAEQKDMARKKEIREEVLALSAAFTGQKKALQDAKKGIEATEVSYRELELETQRLRKQLISMPGTINKQTGAINKDNEAAKRLADQIKRNTGILKQWDAQMGRSFRNVGNYKSATSGLRNYLAFTTGFFGTAFIAAEATKRIVDSNIKISDSLTEVQRVAGLTTQETDALYDSIKSIGTRTSLSGLLDLSRIGAQLGIAKEDLAGFTEALNELSVTLGSEIQGGPEGIATSLGKVNQLLGIDEKYGVAEGLKKTGSAILSLGQHTIATGDYLADFAERVGGVAKIAHISLPTLLSYGAVLEASGATAELAGTNFQALIIELGRAPQKFYNIAKAADPKLTLKKFTDYVNNDAGKAIHLFFEGLDKSSSSFTDFAKNTKETGLTGRRMSQVFSAIATNLKDVDENIKNTNKDFQSGAIIADQYSLKNDNLAGSIAQLKNEITKLVTDPNSSLGGFFKGLIQDLTYGIKLLDAFSNDISKFLGGRPNVKNIDYDAMIKHNIEQFKKFDKESQKITASATQKNMLNAARNANDLYAKYQKAGSLSSILFSPNGPAKRSQLREDYNEALKREKALSQLYSFQLKILNGQKVILKGNKTGKGEANNIGIIQKLRKQIKDATKQRETATSDSSINLLNKEIERLQKELNLRLGIGKAVKDNTTSTTELYNKQIALDKARREAQQENAQKEKQSAFEIAQSKLQQSINANEAIVDDNRKSLDDRLDALKEFLEQQKRLIEIDKQKRLSKLQSDAEQQALEFKQRQALIDEQKRRGRNLTDKEAQDVILGVKKPTPEEVEKIVGSLANQKKEIIVKSNEKLAQLLQGAGEKTFNLVTSAPVVANSDNQFNDIEAGKNQRLMDNNAAFSQGLISRKKYEEKQNEIIFQAQQERLFARLKNAKKRYDIAFDTGKGITDAAKNFNNLLMQLDKLQTEHFISNEERKRQSAIDTFGKIQQYGGQALSVIGSLIDNQVTAQKNALQDQLDAVQKNKEAEIESVNTSLLSHEQKADKIAVINAKAQAQEEAIRRKQRQADQEKARFDKAQAIFNIILNTAVAITEALSKPFLIPIVAALGAAELAVAAAAPIPKYAKGRKGGKAEMAIVGEQGTEMVQIGEKNYLTPDSPTLTFLPENAIVKPNNETMLELFKMQGNATMRNIPHLDKDSFNAEYMKYMGRKMDELKGAVKSIQLEKTTIAMDKNGFRKWTEKGAARTKWVNGITG